MTSYNKVNGRYTSENPELLKDVLRGDWNYPGMVMTDWGGGKDPIAQMKAGNDLLMPGNWQDSVITKAVSVNRTLDEETLNENVSNILKFIKRTPRYREYQPTLSPDLVAHRSLVRKAGAESMVLLKNSKMALPLAAKKKVALFGKGSYCTAGSGTGSGFVNTEHTVTLSEGFEMAGYKVDASLKSVYDKYIAKTFADWKETEWYFPKETAAIYAAEMSLDNAAIRKAAANDDIAVITLQRCSGEGWDRSENDYFELSDAEKSLISSVSSAFRAAKKRVVVVLNISGV
ncbi:MAG: glycoside hydrolase family 3 C-terminal domain-containing protein, partial [Bacteroidales bacterium]